MWTETTAAAPVFDTPTLIELLVVAGIFTALAETVRWFFGGRNRARVDNAKIVQGMAIDLVQPIHDELANCRSQVSALRQELDDVLAYALVCHSLLTQPEVTHAVENLGRRVPVAPETVLKRP